MSNQLSVENVMQNICNGEGLMVNKAEFALLYWWHYKELHARWLVMNRKQERERKKWATD